MEAVPTEMESVQRANGKEAAVPYSSFPELLVGLCREAQIGLGFQFGSVFHCWFSPPRLLSSTGQHEKSRANCKGKGRSLKGGERAQRGSLAVILALDDFWGPFQLRT